MTGAGGRARRPIFALDPRLLPGAIVALAGVDAAWWNAYWTATRNSLRALSEQSGGFALEEGQDLAATLMRISDFVRQRRPAAEKRATAARAAAPPPLKDKTFSDTRH